MTALIQQKLIYESIGDGPSSGKRGVLSMDEGESLLATIPQRVSHVFVGLLAEDARTLLDTNGEEIGYVHEGDSFVKWNTLSKEMMRQAR